MKILNEKELLKYSTDTEMLHIYLKKAFDNKNITENEYNSYLVIEKNINKLHHNSKDIEDNFNHIFSIEDEKGKFYTPQLTRGQGSVFCGLKINDNILLGEHVEMGTIFMVPKNTPLEKSSQYLDIIEFVNEGLINKDIFNTLTKYFSLEEDVVQQKKFKR